MPSISDVWVLKILETKGETASPIAYQLVNAAEIAIKKQKSI
jgi:hypothetical protein